MMSGADRTMSSTAASIQKTTGMALHGTVQMHSESDGLFDCGLEFRVYDLGFRG